MFWRVTASSCSWSSTPKRLFATEHGIIFQKTWIFSSAAVRTSSLTLLSSLILKAEVNTASCDTLCLLCTLMLVLTKVTLSGKFKVTVWLISPLLKAYLKNHSYRVTKIITIFWGPTPLCYSFQSLNSYRKELLNSNGCYSIGSDKRQNMMKLWFQLRWQ